MADTTTATTTALASVQQALTESITVAKHHRDASVEARKGLVDCTKQLQKHLKQQQQQSNNNGNNNSIEETTALAKTVIQQYRDAIDQLTKRCKQAESSVVQVQTLLVDIQEEGQQQQQQQQQQQVQQLLTTVATLTREVESQQAQLANAKMKETSPSPPSPSSPSPSSNSAKHHDAELQQLRQEIREYEDEFRGLKNQDITIRTLQDRITELQSAAATALEQAVTSVQLEAQSQLHAATDDLQTQLAHAHTQTQQYKVQWQSELAFREATQSSLHASDNVVAQREAAWEAQRLLLQDEVQRLQEQQQQYRTVVVAPRSGSGVGNSTTATTEEAAAERNAYEAELAELADTNTALRNELRQQKEQAEQQVATATQERDTLERQQQQLQATVTALEQTVQAAPHPEQIATMQRELRILKRLEYNTTEDDDDEEDDDVAAQSNVGDDNNGDTLETVLVAKLRKAEQDLIAERNERQRLATLHGAMQKELSKAEQAKEASVQLVATLEKDLETAIVAQASSKKDTSTKPPMAMAPQGENPNTLQNILDPKSAAATSATPVATAVAVVPPPPPSSANHDDHSVATIVMAQRDRLRARCDALEAERDSFKRELQAQVQAAASYQSDNAKLYEKVRYLQNFQSSSSAGGVAARGGGATRDLDLEALEQRYEASVDPFRQFSKTERQRKVKAMSPMERSVYVVARTVLSTKEMRTGLFFYVLALHLLVFFTTYHWSAAGCHNTASADMEKLSLIAPHMQEHLIHHKEGEAIP